MTASPAAGQNARVRQAFAVELRVMLAFGAAIVAVVAAGGAITSAVGPHAPGFLTAIAYAGPAALAFAAYCVAARMFHRAQGRRQPVRSCSPGDRARAPSSGCVESEPASRSQHRQSRSRLRPF